MGNHYKQNIQRVPKLRLPESADMILLKATVAYVEPVEGPGYLVVGDGETLLSALTPVNTGPIPSAQDLIDTLIPQVTIINSRRFYNKYDLIDVPRAMDPIVDVDNTTYTWRWPVTNLIDYTDIDVIDIDYDNIDRNPLVETWSGGLSLMFNTPEVDPPNFEYQVNRCFEVRYTDEFGVEQNEILTDRSTFEEVMLESPRVFYFSHFSKEFNEKAKYILDENNTILDATYYVEVVLFREDRSHFIEEPRGEFFYVQQPCFSLSQFNDVIGPEGPQGDMGDQGEDGPQGVPGIGKQGIQGPQGYHAWNPLIQAVPDGTRRVLEIHDWIGGEGPKPPTGFVGGPTEMGLTNNIAEAIDFRGPEGPPGPPADPMGVIQHPPRREIDQLITSSILNVDGSITFTITVHFDDGTEVVSTGVNIPQGPRGDQGVQGIQGDMGWSPELGVEEDGERRVIIITGWAGGIPGTEPSALTGMYLSDTGLVATAAAATDIRGATGADSVIPGPQGIQGPAGFDGDDGLDGNDGDDGYSLVFRIVPNGPARVLQVSNLVGGTGSIPPNVLNRYIGPTGLVDSPNDAVDIRGPAGTGGGGTPATGGGDTGYTLIPSIVEDGNRRVILIVQLVGGTGDTPTGIINMYIGSSGLVSSISQAVDIRGMIGIQGPQGPPGTAGAPGSNGSDGRDGTDGAQGPRGEPGADGSDGTDGTDGAPGVQGPPGTAGAPGSNGSDGDDGDTGWSPQLSVVSNGERRVLRITGWTGGTGTAPATGQYIGSSGLVTNIAQAVDIRGPAGTGGGGSITGGGSFLIWAEENSDLSTSTNNGFQWSFGNGTVQDENSILIATDSLIRSLSLARSGGANTNTATVGMFVDEATSPIISVSIPSGQLSFTNTLTTPISIPTGSRIRFRTTAATWTGGIGATVTAGFLTQGVIGDPGPQGQPGPQGEQGERGLQGERGVQGERGPQGDSGTGSTVTGFTGNYDTVQDRLSLSIAQSSPGVTRNLALDIPNKAGIHETRFAMTIHPLDRSEGTALANLFTVSRQPANAHDIVHTDYAEHLDTNINRERIQFQTNLITGSAEYPTVITTDASLIFEQVTVTFGGNTFTRTIEEVNRIELTDGRTFRIFQSATTVGALNDPNAQVDILVQTQQDIADDIEDLNTQADTTLEAVSNLGTEFAAVETAINNKPDILSGTVEDNTSNTSDAVNPTQLIEYVASQIGEIDDENFSIVPLTELETVTLPPSTLGARSFNATTITLNSEWENFDAILAAMVARPPFEGATATNPKTFFTDLIYSVPLRSLPAVDPTTVASDYRADPGITSITFARSNRGAANLAIGRTANPLSLVVGTAQDTSLAFDLSGIYGIRYARANGTSGETAAATSAGFNLISTVDQNLISYTFPNTTTGIPDYDGSFTSGRPSLIRFGSLYYLSDVNDSSIVNLTFEFNGNGQGLGNFSIWTIIESTQGGTTVRSSRAIEGLTNLSPTFNGRVSVRLTANASVLQSGSQRWFFAVSSVNDSGTVITPTGNISGTIETPTVQTVHPNAFRDTGSHILVPYSNETPGLLQGLNRVLDTDQITTISFLPLLYFGTGEQPQHPISIPSSLLRNHIRPASDVNLTNLTVTRSPDHDVYIDITAQGYGNWAIGGGDRYPDRIPIAFIALDPSRPLVITHMAISRVSTFSSIYARRIIQMVGAE